MGTIRLHVPRAKPGELVAKWGRPEPGEAAELVYSWGGAGATKSDAYIVVDALERCRVMDDRSLRAELEARGYDITTLRFSIQKYAT